VEDKLSQADERTYAVSFAECFVFDISELNPEPLGWFRKIITLFLDSRYSMTVLMRLSQYYFRKDSHFARRLAGVLKRLNQVMNNFEHGADPIIYPGIVLHHTGVCITSASVVESGVHFYRNTTLGGKNGGAPYVKKNAKIASHSILIGAVIIGEGAIVAPGAVVVKNVPDYKIAAGVPAIIIGDVTSDNYNF
jgi:serine acetyltransferase